MSEFTRIIARASLVLGLSSCAGAGRDALWARPEGRDSNPGERCKPEADELPAPEAPKPEPARASQRHRYFQLSVQDQDGMPVAGAELRTVNHIVLHTDNHGKAAFYEPDLMGVELYFFVQRAGYELAADAFGNRGKAFVVDEGGSGSISMQRGPGTPPLIAAGERETRLLARDVLHGAECFALRVVDQVTRRGVPLVFLRSESDTLISDSQGMAAFCDPEHLGKRVRFAAESHGYTFAPSEVELMAEPGGSAVLELTRLNLAERLLRSTGQGIYGESQRLDRTVPEGHDALPGMVMAQDAVSSAIYQGKQFWLWGNTDRPAYPLGNFFGAAASTTLLEGAGFDPDRGLSFEYFVGERGVARPMAQALLPSNLPSWLSSLVSLPDGDGHEALFAVYSKPRADLSLAARGLARLDAQNTFQSVGVDYPTGDFVGPRGQPLHVRHGEEDYVYFAPPLRIKARAESLLDAKSYEVFSAFAEARGSALLRDAEGALDYAFRKDARATSADAVSKAGLAPGQSLEGHLADLLTGAAIRPAAEGAQAFSTARQRYVRVFQQLGGVSSFAGEIWYAEADTPLGPWVYAQKIVTHDRYTFYAPWLHPSFGPKNGRFLYFEGSYTTALAGSDVTPTPRYERNQVLYRLDLEEPRLRAPVAVYDASNAGPGNFVTKPALPADTPARAAAFFALERHAAGVHAVYWSGPDCGPRQLLLSDRPLTPALFYAYAADDMTRPEQLVALNAFVNEAGEHAYSVEQALDGYARQDMPLAYVWPSPIEVKLPLADYAPRLSADAGADQCLREAGRGRGALVRLSAAGSSSQDASTLQHAWYLDDQSCPFSKAERSELRVARGVHYVTLEVTDSEGQRARDVMLLEVR